MNFNIYFQGEELYLTASSIPARTTPTTQALQMTSRTVSLSWIIRNIVREELERARSVATEGGSK